MSPPIPVLMQKNNPVGAGTAPMRRLHWPIRTFDSPHPVRATFGEPRGLVDVDGAAGLVGAALVNFLLKLNPLGIPGRRIIHHGIDIKAPDLTRIFAITDGIAKIGGGTGYGRWVQVGPFRYVHLKDTVAEGTRVHAFETVLGRVFPGQVHIHLTRFYKGQPVNPLRFGGMIGYDDDDPPVLGGVVAHRPNGEKVSLESLTGRVALCMLAHDPQSQGGLRTGLYRLSYVIMDRDGKAVVGPYKVFQMDTIPAQAVGNLVYTVQATRHKLSPVFWYRITLKSPSGDTFLNVAKLKPGRYILAVNGADVRGNETVRHYPIRVAGPGAGHLPHEVHETDEIGAVGAALLDQPVLCGCGDDEGLADWAGEHVEDDEP
jgi:hypothetical protein